MVGGEVMQFAEAEQTGAKTWRLRGLLRGRGGTEHIASKAHAVGTPVVLLDDSLIVIDPMLVANGGITGLAAIGLGDDEPAFAELHATGVSTNPLSPVHCAASASPTGERMLRWTRRARGQWRWLDLVEVPLVEEVELYEVGAGPPNSPFATWRVSEPELSLSASVLASLTASHGALALWVRQIGTYGASPPSLITFIE